MSETKKLYRNEKTIVYAKKKNDHFYIENNDDENQNFESKDQNFESENQNFESENQNFESENQNFESENKIFDQKNLNQDNHQILTQTAENEIIQNLKQSIDVVVKLLKSMLNLLIETSKVDQFSRIIEIESKSNSEIKEISASNMKEKKIEIDNSKVLQLFTSKSEENLQFNQIEFNAILKIFATHDAHAQASIQKIQSTISIQKIQSATFTQKIQSTIHETNVIFQKVNKIKRIKKKIYAVTLKQIKSESIKKNSTNIFQNIRKKTECVFLKNYKNDISFESTNYKHLHFSEFKQIIQIEINQLQSKILISEKNIIISNEFIKILSSHRHKNIKHLKLKRYSHLHENNDAFFEKE